MALHQDQAALAADEAGELDFTRGDALGSFDSTTSWASRAEKLTLEEAEAAERRFRLWRALRRRLDWPAWRVDAALANPIFWRMGAATEDDATRWKALGSKPSRVAVNRCLELAATTPISDGEALDAFLAASAARGVAASDFSMLLKLLRRCAAVLLAITAVAGWIAYDYWPAYRSRTWWYSGSATPTAYFEAIWRQIASFALVGLAVVGIAWAIGSAWFGPRVRRSLALRRVAPLLSSEQGRKSVLGRADVAYKTIGFASLVTLLYLSAIFASMSYLYDGYWVNLLFRNSAHSGDARLYFATRIAAGAIAWIALIGCVASFEAESRDAALKLLSRKRSILLGETPEE